MRRRRLNIILYGDIDAVTALQMAARVIENGRISAGNTCYCYGTVFSQGVVEAEVNKAPTYESSDTLRIYVEEEAKHEEAKSI